MERFLILDNDILFCDTLKDRLLHSSETSEWYVSSSTNTDEVLQLVKDGVETNKPFDILLIAQHLDNDVDGIDFWVDLHQISPESDAIIFTRSDDSSGWQKAYDAGAFRYLPKPFDTKELIVLLRSLVKWRNVQRENIWLRVFTGIAEKAELTSDFMEIANIIVEDALQLGFERSRLFWKPDDLVLDQSNYLIGISQAGTEIIPNFNGYHFPISESPYSKAAMNGRDAVFFHGREFGPGFLEKTFPDQFSAPIGEWVLIPLWVDDSFKGDLVLDNATKDRRLRGENRLQLQLFARLVSSILQKSYSYAKERRANQEMEIISEIGKHITTRSALVDLQPLLEDVRYQISRVMDVNNFVIALIDEETEELRFKLHYSEGKPIAEHNISLQEEGMTAHIIKLGKDLYLPNGNEEYVKQQGIMKHGRYAMCWAGIPLRVGSTVFGAIVLHDHQKAFAYTNHDFHLLKMIAERVSGAIQTSRLAERERENARQLDILSRAGAEFMGAIGNDENLFWHALLTLTTASFGFQYNRAWLFLSDSSRTKLKGVLGVGYRREHQARKAWEKDVKEQLDFERTISLIKTQKIRLTPLYKLTQEITLPIENADDAFAQVFKSGERVVHSANTGTCLPHVFVRLFKPGLCAVLPLRSGGEVIGVVVVDDKYNQRTIRKTALDRLETLFGIAGQAWQNLRQRKKLEAQQDSTYAIMGESGSRPLGDILTRICHAVLTISDADCAIIYPLEATNEPIVYDVDNMGAAGHIAKFDISKKPRQKGVSAHILRSGTIVVSDIFNYPAKFDGLDLAEHPFLKREKVRAFIGLPIRATNTNKLLGIFYLDFRSPRNFTREDVSRAESFANLAAIAIQNARTYDLYNTYLKNANQLEWNAVQSILEEALIASKERIFVRTLIINIQNTISTPNSKVVLVLKRWQGSTNGNEPQEILLPYMLDDFDNVTEAFTSSFSDTLAKNVMDQQESILTDEGKNAYIPIIISIKSGKQSLGVIHVHSETEMITSEQILMLTRIASTTSLALENFHRQEKLETVLKIAKAITKPTNFDDTLGAIIQSAREVLPDLSALTIWYREPSSGTIKAGPMFGVRDKKAVEKVKPILGSLVWDVMNSDEPFWSEDAKNDDRLARRFVREEGVVSAAAFPLKLDQDRVGAIFFNYRKQNRFLPEERAMLEVFTEFVAISVRDAIQLDEKLRESERLDSTLTIAEAVGTTLELEAIIDKVLDKLASLFKRSRSTVCLLIYDEFTRRLKFTPASQRYYQVDNPDFMPVQGLELNRQAIATRVAKRALAEKSLVIENIPDVNRDQDYFPAIASTQSEICVGLFSEKSLLGVLVLESPNLSAYDDDAEKLIHGIARQINTAIDRSRKSKQLQNVGFWSTFTAWEAELAHDVNREVYGIRRQANRLKFNVNTLEDIRKAANEIDFHAGRLASIAGLDSPSSQSLILDEDLPGVIKKILISLKSNTPVIYDLNCPGATIKISTTTLYRLIRHLVRNAIEAMDEKGKLTIHTFLDMDNMIEIRIEDEGGGISDSVLQTLLQEPVSTKSESGGYGLLLAQLSAARMGGKITLLSSKPGKGTTFSVHLPASENDLVAGE